MKQKAIAVVAVLAIVGLSGFGAFSTQDAFGAPSDVHGIPAGNPNHHPDDGDGVCEKGETIIKTTPSGNKVNVPCHVQGGNGNGNGNGHGH